MRALSSFAEMGGRSDADRVAGGRGESGRAGFAIRLACATLLGIYLAFAILIVTSANRGLDPAGIPLGYDFSAFHAAARLAAEGHAAAAYDDPTMIAAERAAFPGEAARLPWNYPPSFLLVLLPLAALPYAWAWLAWTGTTLGAYAAVARTIGPRKIFWPLLLAPAAAVNVVLGQNGLVTAILMGLGMALLPRRPVLAGLALGLLSYKPHLAVLVPIALVAGREWRALGGAAASALGFAGLSIARFGVAPWLAFLGKAGNAAAVAASSSSDWRAVPSTLVMVKDLGGSDFTAAAIHAGVAIFALAALVWIWARPTRVHWRGAALAIAALLATPYVRIYDFTLLALPIAAVVSARPRPGWWQWSALTAIWLLPLLLLAFGRTLPAGPPMLVAAMMLILGRAAASSGPMRFAP